MLRPALVPSMLIALLAPSVALAGPFEKQIKRRWLGAWVVVTADLESDCGPGFTPNRVNDGLTRSDGLHAFEAGELGEIEKIDIKRSRLDVGVRLVEPLLEAYASGPFELYRERRCRVELEVMLDRDDVKAKDLDAVDAALGRIVERHTSEASARASDAFNGREIEQLPEDYELTLARHAVWRAETTNDAVQAKLDEAFDVASELSARVRGEDEYLAGFAQGVEKARGASVDGCDSLLRLPLRAPYRRSRAKDAPPVSDVWAGGFADGRSLVHGLELIRRLPGCFVEVPPLPDDAPFEIGAVRGARDDRD